MPNIHYNVFKDVHESLKGLLAYILAPGGDPTATYIEPPGQIDLSSVTNVDPVNIVDNSPGHIDTWSGNMVSLFLYQVQPSTYVRNRTSASYNDVTGAYDISNIDIALDLSYMITAFSDSRENEAGILERIVHVLNGDAVIKGAWMTGTLADNGNEEIRIQPVSHNLDEINKIWSIFPNKVYRLSLFYTLSPVMIKTPKIIPAAPPITSKGGQV